MLIFYSAGLLIFRTFAFWHQSKKLLVWLLVLAAVSANSMIYRSNTDFHLDSFAF
jgi:hypothetical protein